MQGTPEAPKTDQYLEPFVIVDADGKAVGTIEDGDAVVLFNFRCVTRIVRSHLKHSAQFWVPYAVGATARLSVWRLPFGSISADWAAFRCVGLRKTAITRFGALGGYFPCAMWQYACRRRPVVDATLLWTPLVWVQVRD